MMATTTSEPAAMIKTMTMSAMATTPTIVLMVGTSGQLLRPAFGFRPWFAFERRALDRFLSVRFDMADNRNGDFG